MFTNEILREPQAYICGLRLASLSEDKDKNLDLPEGSHLRAANMWNLVILLRDYFKSCSHIIVNEHMYQEKLSCNSTKHSHFCCKKRIL